MNLIHILFKKLFFKWMFSSRFLFFQCIFFVFFFCCQVPAFAKSFTVRSGYDISDLTPGNGLCVAYLTINPPYVIPYCTFRAAIQETNALPGPDIINLPSGTLRITKEGQEEDLAQTGDFDITDDLEIRGKGPGKTFINADELDRVLDIIEPGITVTISGVSIINGKLPAGLPIDQKGGAGIRNQANLILSNCVLENNSLLGNETGDSGAGISNSGSSKLYYSTVTSNDSEKEGGALLNTTEGRLVVYASTINDNTAETGGGITNYGSASLINMTISTNQADSSEGAGGGVENYGTMNIQQSTIANNLAASGGGIDNAGELSMINTLLTANSGDNCTGISEIISQGGNLDDNSSCLMTVTDEDLFNVDPRLKPLESNGGLTLTHRIYYSSPARDRGKTIASIVRDQRGQSHTIDKKYDIGSFEATRPITPILERLLLVKEWDNNENDNSLLDVTK